MALAWLAGCSGSSSPVVVPGAMPQNAARATHTMPQWQAQGLARAACPQVVGKPTCYALIEKKGVSPACVGSSCGWTPIDFQTRYNLPITKGSGHIVAIVDAGDNPNAATDIAEYRSEFGLGTPNFFKYNQEGQQGNYPPYTAWSVEIDLDIEMVSAACPLCTIYLVEANSSDSSDLDAAEAEAVNLGAHIISNSWGCPGSISCVDVSDFDTPGVTYVAATGDSGLNQVGAPAAFASVAAIGGTQLMKSGSTYSETVWDDAGGGCVTGVPKPKWQHDKVCASGRPPTHRRKLGAVPALRSTTATTAAGSASAAPAPLRRWLRLSSDWQATRRNKTADGHFGSGRIVRISTTYARRRVCLNATPTAAAGVRPTASTPSKAQA